MNEQEQPTAAQAHTEIPIYAAKELAEKYRKDWIIVLGYDPESSLIHTTTYGASPRDKLYVADLGPIVAMAVQCDLSQTIRYHDFRQQGAAIMARKIEELGMALTAIKEGLAATIEQGILLDFPAEEQVRDMIATAEHALKWHGDPYFEVDCPGGPAESPDQIARDIQGTTGCGDS